MSRISEWYTSIVDIGSFLPQIVRQYDRNKPWEEWIHGTVLFADVSGFTAMSETLSVLGAEGAELLTDIINRYFASIIRLIHNHGGQVMKFGGDAILCFFPGEDSLHRTLYTATLMQDGMKRFQRIKTPVKYFSLKMKIGVAEGTILLAGIGNSNSRCDYIFAGSAVDFSSEAEHHAKSGEIILLARQDPKRIKGLEYEELKSSMFRILRIPEAGRVKEVDQGINDHTDSFSSFIIPEIQEMVSTGREHHAGALLTIIPVFFKFSGFTYTKKVFDLHKFNEFFTAVMDITTKFDGRLNRISMGDKGSTFLILFGAPTPKEQIEQQASQWSIEVKQMILENYENISLGIGMNSGRAFTGIVGGSGRWDYTVMGSTVNLSARIMQSAEENQICTSETVRDKASKNFRFKKLGMREFKGIAQSTPIYELLERQRFSQAVFLRESIFDRKEETKTILTLMETAKAGKPSLVILEGEAGVGKTFLSNHILSIAQSQQWQCIAGKGEISRSNHAYGPWVDIFLEFLFQGDIPTFKTLQRTLPNIDRDYLPWLAEFFGTVIPEEVKIQKYDESSSKNILHHILSQLLLQLTDEKNILLFLDDLHWFDTLSMELLVSLMNHLRNQPLFILSTSRPDREKSELDGRIGCYTIPLENFSPEGLQDLAGEILGGPMGDSLKDLVIRSTRGNPLIARQLLEYLQGANLLQRRLGEWVPQSHARIEHLQGTEDIILARIEKLTLTQRAHLMLASCFGNQFHLLHLKEVMGKDFVQTAILDLDRAGYFLEKSITSRVFSHTLVRETIYRMIPSRVRRKSHKKISGVLERALSEDVHPEYSVVADHYSLAGEKKKSLEFSNLAADQLFHQCSFHEASKYYERTYDLLKFTRDHKKWDIAHRLVMARMKSGKVFDALTLSKRIRKLLRKKDPVEYKNQFLLAQFDCMEKLGKYSYINSAEKMLSAIHKDYYDQLLYLIGVAHFRHGDFDQARRCFEIIVSKENVVLDFRILALYFLASIAKGDKQFDHALTLLVRATNIARSCMNLHQELRVQIEFANVLIECQFLNTAREVFTNLIPQIEAQGDYYLLSGILLNLSNLEMYTNRLDEALSLVDEAGEIFQSLGIKSGLAESYNYRGIACYYKELFQEAYDNYSKAASFFKEIHEKEKLCHCYINLAEVCLNLDKPEESRKWFNEGLKSFPVAENPGLKESYDSVAEAMRQYIASHS